MKLMIIPNTYAPHDGYNEDARGEYWRGTCDDRLRNRKSKQPRMLGVLNTRAGNVNYIENDIS